MIKFYQENYFQHADHFTKFLNEQENFRKTKISEKSSAENVPNNSEEKKIETTSEIHSNDPSDAQSEIN